MRTLVVVPARGGSKAIVGKNLSMVGGKCLIDWTLELLPHLDLPDYTAIVSTDCPKIAEHCKRQSVWVLDRPSYLAQDDSTTVAVLQHALATVGDGVDAVLCLQPTNPLRTLQDVSAVYRLMEKTDADSVIAEYVGKDVSRLIIESDFDGWVTKQRSFGARQAARQVEIATGEMYLHKRWVVEAGLDAGERCQIYRVPPCRAHCIDDPWDIPIVEGLLRFNGRI